MADENGEFARVRDLVRVFVDERDWDQFHTPKNLSSALSVEAAELLEHFQWLQHGRIDELGPEKLVQVRHEMADVLVYLVRLADKLDMDRWLNLWKRARASEDGPQNFATDCRRADGSS